MERFRWSATNERLALDFPVNNDRRAIEAPALVKALGGKPLEVYEGFQWLVVYSSEDEVRGLAPDMGGILASGIHGVIVTAPGKECDFVSARGGELWCELRGDRVRISGHAALYLEGTSEG